MILQDHDSWRISFTRTNANECGLHLLHFILTKGGLKCYLQRRSLRCTDYANSQNPYIMNTPHSFFVNDQRNCASQDTPFSDIKGPFGL